MSNLAKTTLGQITTSIYDGKHGDCEDQAGSGFYFISVKDLQEYDIDYSGAREITPSDFHQNYTRTNLDNGDTIYANTGDTIGKSLFVKDNPLVYKTSFQKSVAILKPNTDYVEPRYLYYLMKYETPRLRQASTGSGQKNLLLSTMRDFETTIHDRDTQKKIVEVLGCIDDKIRCNNHINDNLEQMAYDTYMHLFFKKQPNGKLGEIIVENNKSSVQVGEAKGKRGDYPFFTSGDAILELDCSMVDGRNCFLNTGGNAGVKFHIGEAAYSTDTWCITANSYLEDYLYLLLLSIKPELNQKFFQGTGLKHLQKPLLKDRLIYIPSEEEIKSFNSKVQPLMDMVSANTRENKRLINLRDWLLPMLMNGQATVSN